MRRSTYRPARYGVGVDREDATFISMLPPAAAGDPAKLVLGLGDGAATSVEEIHDAVANAVREGRSRVILQADGAVPHGAVIGLTSALADIEGITLHIGVQEMTASGASP